MITQMILITLIVGLGGFIQGFVGFGLVLVIVPLLSMIIDVKIAIPVAGVFSWFISAFLALKMRQGIQWRTVLILVLGTFPGAFIGAYFLKYLPAALILIMLGLLLILTSLYSLSGHQTVIKRDIHLVTMLVGFVSGVLGSGVGASGPPVIAYTSMLPWNSHQIKATLLAFFMLQMIGAMLGFWSKGLLTSEVGFYILIAFPGFVVGAVSGVFCYQLVQRHQINFRRIIHVLLLCLGLLLVVENI